MNFTINCLGQRIAGYVKFLGIYIMAGVIITTSSSVSAELTDEYRQLQAVLGAPTVNRDMDRIYVLSLPVEELKRITPNEFPIMSHKIDRLSKPVSPVLAGVVGYTVPKKLELSAVGDFLTYLEENASRLKKIANFDNAHIRLEAINMLASWGGSVVQDPTGPGLNNHAAITYWINQIAQVQPYDGEYAKAVLAEIRALTPVTEKYDTFTVHDRELRLLPEYNNWLWGERGPGAGEPGDDYPLRTVFRLLNVDKDREAREAFWRLLFSDLARTEVSDLTAAEREILAFVRYGDFNKAKRVAMEMLLAENIPHFFYVQKTMIQGYADNGEPDKALDEYLSAYHLQLLSGRYAGTGNGVPDYSSHFREVASLGVIPEETMIKRTMLLHMKENLAEHESGAGGRRLPFLLRRHSYAEDLMLVDLNNLYADLIDHMANTLDGIPPPPGGFQPIPGGLMSVFQTGDAGGTWDDSDSHLPHELDTVIMKHNARFQSGDEARTLRLQIRGQQLMDDMMRLVRDSVDGDPYSYTPVMSNKEIQELTDKFMKDSEAIAYGGAGAEIPPLPVEIIAEAVFWGKLYREHWHYDSAGAELQKALDVIDENPEEDAFTAYEALAELVILSAEYGRFRDSETLGNRLRQAAARFSGGDTWDVMSILCDVEMARNDYPAALEAVTLALKQAVRDDGVWHSRLRQKRARVLMQLGMVDYALADLRKSVEIFQEKLGRHNEETLNCALDIVGCLLLKGDRDEAAARYAAAVAGLPPSHGKPRFLYRTHQLRGIMAFFAGDLDGALEHMEAALAVIDAAGRLEIDDRYDIVKALANIHYRRGDVAAALREIDDINRYRVQRTYAAMDAATVLQRYSYIDAINSGKGLDSLWLEPLDLLVAILVRPENAGHITVERLDSLVNGKAVALDSLRRGKYEGEIDRDEFREYVEAKSRLAQLWIERGESGRRIAPLREAGEAGIIQAFERERYGTTEATPDAFLRLQTLLPDRAVIVDYHRYRDYRSGTAGSIPDNRYAALVLSGTTYRFVDLGEADGMDEQIDSLLAALDRGAIDFRERAVLVGLRNRLLGPVEAFTREKDRLIVCPDAAIGNVPFALLHDRSERYVVEDFTPVYVSSLRSLLEGDDRRRGDAFGILYGSSERTVSRDVAAAATDGGAVVLRGARQHLFSHTQLRTLKQKLRGVYNEVVGLRDLLAGSGVRVVISPEKEFLLDASPAGGQSLGTLHIAAHGFAVDRDADNAFDNPFLLSGLVLGNEDDNPSFLTSFEIQALDFSGVGLVTISACQSGRGQAYRREGIAGLKSAFLQSGSGNVMTTHYNVNDLLTPKFMVLFYKKYLRNMDDPAASLAAAQREALNGFGAEANPVVWGAFSVTSQGKGALGK